MRIAAPAIPPEMAAILIRFACSSSSFSVNSVTGAAASSSAAAACADVSLELPSGVEEADDGKGMPLPSATDAGVVDCVWSGVLVVFDDVLVEIDGAGEEGVSGVDGLAVSVLASSVVRSACRPDEGDCDSGTDDVPSTAFCCMLAGSTFSGGRGSDAAFPSTGNVSLTMSEAVDADGGVLEPDDAEDG